MAETVSIDGQPYLKRNPLGVLGLSVVTLGIYFLYWYYKINDELKRFEHDPSISPTRALMAMIFGWIIIVPPFIAMYNTAKHVQGVEQRMTVQPADRARAHDRHHAVGLGRQRHLHPGTPQPDMGSRRRRAPGAATAAGRDPAAPDARGMSCVRGDGGAGRAGPRSRRC